MQCAIPVFDGLLLEPHNQRILDLLFVAAHWHSLAKLRMHTDPSLEILDNITVSLGEQLQLFQQKTCSVFPTRELRREAETRQRRSMAIKGKASSLKTPAVGSPPETGSSSTGQVHTKASGLRCARRPKTLNLNTYKYHALGDYASMIRKYGTTDSYSTEVVSRLFFAFFFLLISDQGELEHRTAKSRYTRTSRKAFTKQLAQIERRQVRIRRVQDHLSRTGELATENVLCDSDVHHNIGSSQNHPLVFSQFLIKHAGDPTIAVCTISSTCRQIFIPIQTGLLAQTEGSPSTTSQGYASGGNKTEYPA